jgi:hypothetical protein
LQADTVTRIQERFAEFPAVGLKGEGVLEAEIDELEARLGTKLPEGYREFLRLWGGGVVGPFDIYGLRPAGAMGKVWSVLEVNASFRDWPGNDGWVVFSGDGYGNPIAFDRDHRVIRSDHDGGFCVDVLAPDFEGFLRKYGLDLPG